MRADNAWMDRAFCVGADDPEQFFPTTTGNEALQQAERVAARFCAHCPVVAQCDAYRRSTGSVGVWGSVLVASRKARSCVKTDEHGTKSGYDRHRYRGEKPCAACFTANSRKKWR